MKASEFKKLIKETVKEAIKEALQEGITPSDLTIQETSKAIPTPAPKHISGDPITSMIAETRSSMSTEDYRNVVNADSSMAPNFQMQSTIGMEAGTPDLNTAPKVGIDIAGLDFIKNASKVLKASEEKDRMKYGV